MERETTAGVAVSYGIGGTLMLLSMTRDSLQCQLLQAHLMQINHAVVTDGEQAHLQVHNTTRS